MAKLLRYTSNKGMSLIEVAMALGLISICTGMLLQLVGGNRLNMQQGQGAGASYASHSQMNSHKSQEYLFATSLAERMSNGGIETLNANERCGLNGQVGVPYLNVGATVTTGICTNNNFNKPIFYQWQLSRPNNANVTPNSFNANTGQWLPDSNYPVGNEFYVANLRIFSNNTGAPNSFQFNYPVSMFRNVQAPPPVQSNLIASVSIDSSGSMALTHNGLPRMVYAKESLREFVGSMRNNPYVSNNSVLSLQTFNTTYGLGYNSEIAFTQQAANGTFPGFENRITCIMPADNECLGQPKIEPTGQTNLQAPMLAALSDISNRNNLYVPYPVPNNPLASKRNYDKLWIFVSDGNDTVSPAGNYASMRALAKQYGFDSRKEDRITIFTIGLLGSDINGNENTNQTLLRQMTQSTPYGIYIPTEDVSQLQSAFGNISNQFQFFSLKHKPERWGVFL